MIQQAKSRDVVEKKAVGIWIRVSTEDQAQGESPDHHRRRAEMYAESKGWQIVRVYDLSGVSGKSVIDHPEAKAMMADVASGRVKALIFSKLARLARNTRELLDFAEYFEKHRADLVSLAESIDTSTPAGRFFYTLIAALAQWEREEISSRAKASVVVRAKMGKSLGGAAPYGYRRDGTTLVPDEKEAPIRRHMFELFLTHKRLRTVATEMNKAGYRTRNGSKFSNTTVRRLLEDPIAKGLKRANYTRSRGQKKHWDVKDRDEWIFQSVPAIVAEETWTAANAILAARAEGQVPKRRSVYLFSSLARCARDGATMQVLSESPSYTCPKCRLKIRRDTLEEVFRDRLQSFFLSSNDVREYLETGNEALGEKRALLAALQDEVIRVRSDMDKTYRLYLEGVITTTGFGERYGPLELRSKQLAEEIPRLQGEADFLAIQHLSSEEVVSQAQDLYGGWDHLSEDEKRGIVEHMVERVTVSEDSVSIELFNSPAPPPIGAVGVHNHTDSSPRREKTEPETQR